MNEKIYCQTNYQGFFISLTANIDWAGAIDTTEPIYDKATEKAKWDNENHAWIIKKVSEWERIEELERKEQRIKVEKQMKSQEELN